MPTLLTDVAMAAAVFAATNIDDVFLLLAFFAERRYRASHVVAGQYLGITALFTVSIVASTISAVIERPWLGLLGLIPLALGIKAAFALRDPADDDEAPTMGSSASTTLTVASITIANGGDNLGIYIPLFTTLSATRIALVGAVFVIMIAVWCALARRLVNHPAWGPKIRRISARLLPFVFIGLGVWIIVEMETVRLLWS